MRDDHRFPIAGFGTDSVQYIVTAIRGSVNGTPSNAFTVQFGVSREFVAGSSTANVKLAA